MPNLSCPFTVTDSDPDVKIPKVVLRKTFWLISVLRKREGLFVNKYIPEIVEQLPLPPLKLTLYSSSINQSTFNQDTKVNLSSSIHNLADGGERE